MIHYGIELEFFTYRGKDLVPAYKVTGNLDGNPVVGEIRTGIFSNPVDLFFDLQKRIYLEREALAKHGCNMLFRSEVKGSADFRKELRKDRTFINRKNLEVLEEFSIYPDGATSKEVEEIGIYQGSLQINISDNEVVEHNYVDKDNKDRKFSRNTSNLFNFYPIIEKLDKAYGADIKRTNRVPGVFAIKDGNLGKRIEYRSLPNSVNYEQLLKIL
jgi:hypothetical protein